MNSHYLLFLGLILFVSCKNESKKCNCTITNSDVATNVDKDFPNVELFRISYTSDSLEISGFIAKPKNIGLNEKMPLIIYNRGGNRDYGVISLDRARYLRYLSSLGYVVMSSQYRGNSLSEGNDEFGGSDINDIKCLIEIARNIDYVDIDNIGVLGYSRGGLMAYLLSKDTDEIKTIITVGAPTDLFLLSENRPELYNQVFYELIGDSVSERQEFIKRSPIYWSNMLNEPALIIHGTDDKKINIEQSKRLFDSLNNFPNKITSMFVEGGNHSVSNYRKIRNDTIANWFNYYLKAE